MLLILFLQSYLVAVTFFNDGRIAAAIVALAKVAALFILLEAGLRTNKEGMLLAIRLLFCMLALITLITTLASTDGMYYTDYASSISPYESVRDNARRFFLGHKNSLIPSLMPGALCSVLLWMDRERRSDLAIMVLYFAAMLTVAIVVESVLSFLTCILLIASVKFAQSKIAQDLHPLALLAFVVALNFGVTVFGIQDLFTNALGYLGRESTLSGRTDIWECAMSTIANNPIFGYGVESEAISRSRLNGFSTAHNLYLTTLYYGGITALAFLLASIGVALYKTKKKASNCTAFSKLFLIAMMIMGVVESLGIGLTTLVVPICFCYCSDVFFQDNSRKAGVQKRERI